MEGRGNGCQTAPGNRMKINNVYPAPRLQHCTATGTKLTVVVLLLL